LLRYLKDEIIEKTKEAFSFIGGLLFFAFIIIGAPTLIVTCYALIARYLIMPLLGIEVPR
jgi:hypothetical protein